MRGWNFYVVLKAFIVMFCAIWCHLYDLKNLKNTQGEVLLWLLHGCFSRFLNCTNGIKSCSASMQQMVPNRATHHIYNPAIFLFVSFYYYFFVVIFVSTRTYLFSRLIRCLGADFARGDKEKQWSICKSEIRAFLVKICQCLGIFS